MALASQRIGNVSVIHAANARAQKRVTRTPRHTFNLKAKPYEIAPFMIAPVLPGESMTNLLMQSRVVTDPIQNSLIGWWKEYYFYYVPLLGLSAWDTAGALQAMMLDPTTNVAALVASANSTPYYTFKGGFDYVQACVKAIIAKDFRDEGEAVTVASIENYYAAQIDQDSWLQSIKLESETGDDTELPGVDEIEETDILTGFTTHYAQWEIMRDSGMTDLDYDDFIRSYGVDVPPKEEVDVDDSDDTKYQPELVRFFRKFTYPSNTINPSDGVPASAVSWSIAERADKRRFFRYPGFLVGVTVTRPKIYFGSQKGAASGLLDSVYGWMNPVLAGHPYTTVDESLDSATEGILQNQTEDYWLDLKDLFLKGDQFVNHTMGAAANHGLAIPTAALDTKYPTDAMIESLFKTANVDYVREDGVVHLDVLSRLVETTP